MVEAPDWNPNPEREGGLYGLLEGRGDWDLLKGVEWLVIEADENDIVIIDDDKCKFRKGKILYRGDKSGLSRFLDRLNFDSRSAYHWAYHIGDLEVMRDKVIDSEWAYKWALNIGDLEVMRDRITDSKWAYKWALNIGDREDMRDRITDSKCAYKCR